jgi:hypothetical protein
MNTLLKALFEKYRVSEKNKYEILQIWSLLPDVKKQNILNNFEALAIKLQKIEEELNTEKEILLGFIANKQKG